MTTKTITKVRRKFRPDGVTREVTLALKDAKGRDYNGRFDGTRLLDDPNGNESYLTPSGDTVLYDPSAFALLFFDLDGVAFEPMSIEERIEFMAGLELRATIDLIF
jgi:hypothetical protein